LLHRYRILDAQAKGSEREAEPVSLEGRRFPRATAPSRREKSFQISNPSATFHSWYALQGLLGIHDAM
jgi:hypothetical protein